jgi:hypothetical protein
MCFLRFLLLALALIIGAIVVAWTAGALYFDLPTSAPLRTVAAITWSLVAMFGLFRGWRGRLVVLGVLGTMERRVRLSNRHRLFTGCAGYSWSTAGLRNGRSSPRATVSGTANEYRPSMLMWSWISGESLATSASQTWYPSKRNCLRAASM